MGENIVNIEVLGNLRVKCTLTSEYLKSRWIDAGDLAYGSEAATALFRVQNCMYLFSPVMSVQRL